MGFMDYATKTVGYGPIFRPSGNPVEDEKRLAEFYATKMQDRELFEERLKWVLEQPIDVIPELVPLNRIEKEKAKEKEEKTTKKETIVSQKPLGNRGC